MGHYSIKELEQLSGIKAHTIRIWEKRHQIIAPQRTKTNIRFYSDEDLKKIINVSMLNTHGMKISRIAGMSLDEMSKTVLALSETHGEASVFIDQLIVALVDMDEERFEKILSGLMLRFDFEKTVTSILYPFLEKIGVLWQTRNITPAQEHFISNLVRQKIIVAIDSLPLPPATARRVLLYLPENEQHEVGLLFYHYLVRKNGYRTYYLGQNVPHADLISIVATHEPEMIVTSITSSVGNIVDYLNRLSRDFPNRRLLVSGYQIQQVSESNQNVTIFRSALELKEYL